MFSFIKSSNSLISLNVGLVSKIREFLYSDIISIPYLRQNSFGDYDIDYRHINDKDYTINDDLTIDINTYIHVCYYYPDNSLKINPIILPDFIKFNKIEGNFNINYNDLISLRGCPDYINGDFDCSDNKLTNLDYCPKIVEKDFICTQSKFTEEDIRKVCNVKGKVIL